MFANRMFFLFAAFAVLSVVFAGNKATTVDNEHFFSEKVVPKVTFPPVASNILEQGVIVPVNHFNPRDGRTFNLTYNLNLDYFEYYGAPLFVYIKDGGDYSTRWIEEGLMIEVARNTSAALITLDLRYFNRNIPTESASLDDLQFLTPEQMIQDIAAVINDFNLFYRYYGRTILWGSGYGATIATWARKKLPHLIDAVWSSSGVYEIALGTLSPYDNLAYAIYSGGGFDCRNTVQAAFDELEALVTAGRGDEIQEILDLCETVDTDDEQEVSFLFETYYGLVSNYIEDNHAPGVQNFCRDLAVLEDTPLASLARWVDYVYHSLECRDVSYANFVETHSVTEWNLPGTFGLRQWYFIQCTQAGLFQITDHITWLPDRVQLAYHVQKCQDIFGPEYEFDFIRQANIGMIETYGSFDQYVSSALYTNGYLNPWIFSGIYYSYAFDSFVHNIEHVGRSADLTARSGSDAYALATVKNAIFNQIITWTSYPEW